MLLLKTIKTAYQKSYNSWKNKALRCNNIITAKVVVVVFRHKSLMKTAAGLNTELSFVFISQFPSSVILNYSTWKLFLQIRMLFLFTKPNDFYYKLHFFSFFLLSQNLLASVSNLRTKCYAQSTKKYKYFASIEDLSTLTYTVFSYFGLKSVHRSIGPIHIVDWWHLLYVCMLCSRHWSS